MATLMVDEENEKEVNDGSYINARKKTTRWDHALLVTGKIMVAYMVCYFVAWMVGVFIIEAYAEPNPSAPIPGLPIQTYATIDSVDSSHWRLGAHIAILAICAPLMMGRGGEISSTMYIALVIVLATDIYSILDASLRIYSEQHPNLKVFELILAIAGIVSTVAAMIWYTLVYYRYMKHSIRFDGIPSDDVIFKRRFYRELDRMSKKFSK